MYFNEEGRLRSLPTSWTSVRPPDEFVEASAGRSFFRIQDLLELSRVIKTLEAKRKNV